MLRVTCALLLVAGNLSCGPRPDGDIDAGGPTAPSPVCSVPVGAVMPGVMAFTFTGDSIMCTGDAVYADGGSMVTMCSNGPATVTPTTCPDGFGFTITSGSETVLLRMQGGSQWSAGAVLEPGLTLTGDASFSMLEAPSQLTPSAGTMNVSFVLQDVTGSNVVMNGELTTTWQ